LTKDDELVSQFKEDYKKAPISTPDRAMLDYARKLTLEPRRMEESDVATLKEMGFSDAAILNINQVAGYFAFVNRLAQGLGVELEDFWSEEEF
jgi:uncharacterized peroxidase-related enzyme|tara:strand:+ start:1462 stop:1740 length:279 start_codon:yes stop_codon:yes gene_type:complete